MFAPKSVAVIGASESTGSVGRALMENLRSFSGSVFAVNPNRSTILGRKAFREIGTVPEIIDLAVVATPAATVPQIVAQCATAGVKGAVITVRDEVAINESSHLRESVGWLISA
jgi:acetyltransferase